MEPVQALQGQLLASEPIPEYFPRKPIGPFKPAIRERKGELPSAFEGEKKPAF
jgi:hypothetical protein